MPFSKHLARFVVPALLSFTLGPWAQAEPTPTSNKQEVITTAPAAEVNIEAKAYLLFEANTQSILLSQEQELAVSPASLTKMMTAYVTFEAIAQNKITLDQQFVISANARNMPGSRMFLELGSHVTVQDLLQGLIIQSGNDAAVALAEGVSGTTEQDFALMMNAAAAELGMTGSQFKNASGMTAPGHHTTARDLNILANNLVKKHPDFYKWFGVKSFTYNEIEQQNRNTLLWKDESVDGLKTGYTDDAGYCLMASAQRAGNRLFAVVLGTESPEARIQETQKLLDFGFAQIEQHDIEVSVTKADVVKGEGPSVAVRLEPAPSKVTMSNMAWARVSAPEIKWIQGLEAPISKGQEMGTVTVQLDGNFIYEAKLVADADMARASTWQLLKQEMKTLWADE